MIGTRLPAILSVLLILSTGGCDGGAPEPPVADPDTQERHASVLEEFGDPDLEPFTGDLAGIRERRLLRALVTPSRTDFFVDGGRIRGIQAEYVREFARQLNRGIRDETSKIRIKFVPVPFNGLLPALREGRGDIAAAFLTVTEGRTARVAFAPPLRSAVSEVVVTHRDIEAPQRLEDIAGRRFYVLSGSSYAEHLQLLNDRLQAQGLDPIRIEQADPHLRSEDILEFVNAGVVDMTLVDDYKAMLWARMLPDIVVHEHLEVASGTRVAWAVRTQSPALLAAIGEFVRGAREGALLGNILLERYFGNVRWLQNPNERSERDKLRRYQSLFGKYGDRFGFDPLALAAQAYQESGLDHDARSPAGAIGLMQVLPSTAADPQIDVANIDDPDGNVHAGAKYLAFIRDRYFDDPVISEWDQMAFSWAAYNAGPRRIREARNLAREMGLDPNVWFANVEVAAARLAGREPVRYVANIQRYYVAYRLSARQETGRREAMDILH